MFVSLLFDEPDSFGFFSIHITGYLV